MNTLDVVAQQIMDLYYQEYKSTEDFFELMHFQYMASIVYSDLLQKEYEKSYKLNLAETGIGEASLNPAWFITEHLTIIRTDDGVADFVGELKCPVFQFTFDKSNCGIKDLMGLNGKCKDFIRMNSDERYKIALLPPSPEVYWFPLGEKKIYFANVYCGVSKALVLYIPEANYLNDSAIIPSGIEAQLVRAVLDIMFAARNGKVIDVTEDSNPNSALQTEINNLFAKMRNK